MFDISWGKLVIIGVVALIVIGPKELPTVLRTVGQWMGKIRRMAAEFQGQFQDAMREAEMADLKKQFDDTTASFTSAIDPSGMKADMEKMINDPLGTTGQAVSSSEMPPSDPAAMAATTTPANPEATAPTDPVALGTAPVVPPATADLNLPMPDLPPPVETKDFTPPPAPAPQADAAPASPPADAGGKAA